ncbi:zinc finger MYM-type protein 1-like protein, partial [Aphelenchoides avenae]
MSSKRELSDFFRTTQGTDCSSDLALEASGSQVADHTTVSSDTPEIGKFCCYMLLDEIRLVDQNDFGRAVEEGRSRVTSDEKARWLERDQSWKPPRTFDWPFQLRKRNGVDEKRFLKPEDLEREEARWISYSQLKKGLFCRACFFFSTVRNAAFVDKPYTRYGYLWGRENGITHHITREYHVQAVDSAQLFLKPIGHIDRNFSETDRRVNDAGKHVMKPKIEAAILLAKLGLPFRGRRDGGEIQIIEQISEFTGEEGCFRALLQFGALKSSVEKEALEEANRLSGYASYFSPNIQNQLIQCIGDVIRAKIVKDVCKTGSYAALADETTDISGLCQMAVVARYVDIENSFKICEQFIGMVELSGGTGEHLAAKIIDFVKKCCLEKAKMIGQGYDGAGAMSGVHSGCQTRVRSVHPSAIYVHCSAHNLNLALANASSIAEVKSVMGLISDVHDFFKNHQFVKE